MIIKSTSIKDRTGVRRVVEYVFKEHKQHSLLYSRFLPRNASIDTIVDCIESNESKRIRRRKDSVILFHDLVSFHAGDSDKLQDEKVLRRIARKYAKSRAGQSIAVVVAHRDQAHIHLHCLLSGAQFDNGRSARISQAEFQKCKLEMERFQEQEWGLEKSRVDHRKKKSLYDLNQRCNQ